MTGYMCRACGYDDLIEVPYSDGGGPSYEICPSCGFEPGYSDDNSSYTFESWREQWMREGAHWYSASRQQPSGWDPLKQLQNLTRG